jgi:hypothetical protein
VRRFVGSEEFINHVQRYCLWLADAAPSEIKKLPAVMRRIAGVRAHRLASSRPTTSELANQPTVFGENRQPTAKYLLIPSVSSERRPYIPIGFMPPRVIASNLCLLVPGASLYHLGVLSSQMHMAWVRSVCGRLKSDYRYSNGIVYNNYPWPEVATKAHQGAIAAASQTVLDTREKYPDSSLADLYDPLTMPPDLAKAHQRLDAAVDAAYGKRRFKSDAERVAFLFGLYLQITGAHAATAS